MSFFTLTDQLFCTIKREKREDFIKNEHPLKLCQLSIKWSVKHKLESMGPIKDILLKYFVYTCIIQIIVGSNIYILRPYFSTKFKSNMIVSNLSLFTDCWLLTFLSYNESFFHGKPGFRRPYSS